MRRRRSFRRWGRDANAISAVPEKPQAFALVGGRLDGCTVLFRSPPPAYFVMCGTTPADEPARYELTAAKDPRGKWLVRYLHVAE